MTIYNNDFTHDIVIGKQLNVKDSIIYFEWLHRQLENSKKILWIIGLPSYPDLWNKTVTEKFNQLPSRPDKILLNSSSDNYSIEMWNGLIDILLDLGYDKSQLLGIYSNCISPISTIPCLAEFKLLNRYQFYENTSYTDIFSRKYKFLSLSGMPRPHKVVFTKELLIRNLQDRGIITCGSISGDYIKDKANILYDFLNLGEYKSQFPIIHDTEYSAVTDNEVYSPFLDARYNVVVESAFEDYMNLKEHPDLSFFMFVGPEAFVTEKTTKAFGFYQIPVFVSVKGYVEEVRKLGFDVFDDIVDHSYDKIDDPYQRMVSVANEVERLVNIDLPDYNLKDRLIKNHDIMKELYFKQKQHVSLEILKWFNQ